MPLASRDSAAPTPPMLKHWREVKSRHPDTILFYRVGDFYEMFHEDAQLAARILDITLTSRGDGVPLAGVPVKAAAEYLRQLVGAGHRVAICEQVEDPKLARGLVRREVVETLTPGALMQEGWVAGARNNWMVALAAGKRVSGEAGKHEAWRLGSRPIDLSTGEFVLETSGAEGLEEAISRLSPAEMVIATGDAYPRCPASPLPRRSRLVVSPGNSIPVSPARRWPAASAWPRWTGSAWARRMIQPIGAAGALLRYLGELQPGGLPHLTRPIVRRSDAFLWIDEMTRRNLELVEPLRAGARGCTLLEIDRRHAHPHGWPAPAPVAPLAAPGSGRDQRPARCGRGERAGRRGVGPAFGRRWTACAMSSGWPAGPRRAARRPGSSARCVIRFSGFPTWPARSTHWPARLCPTGGRSAALAEAADELDLLADLSCRARRGARRAASGRPGRRRSHPPRLRHRARRAAVAA